MQNFYNNDTGIAATEFALLAPILLFLLIGIFDYGSYVNSSIKLEGTALAAAQYLRVGGDAANLEAEVLLESSLGLDAGNIDDLAVTITYDYECSDPSASADADTDCGAGDYLREYVDVNLSMTYDSMIPYPDILGTLTLSGHARLQNN